jgi:O-antigen/teichoic acid export membrane protein
VTVAGPAPAGSPIAAPRRALGNIVVKGASIAVERGAQVVLVFVAARLLGAAAFGRYSYAASLSVLLSFGADLGLTIWTTRALARDPAASAAILGTGLRLRLGASAIVLAIFGVVALGADGRDVRWAILALGTGALARALLDHARAVFRAHERLADEGKVNVATALLSVAGGLGALVATGGGVPALAVGVMAGALVGAGYGFSLLGRRYGRWAGPADRELARLMLRESMPFWLAGIFSLAYARGDVVLLRLLSTDAEVGVYRTAGQLLEVAKQLPVLVMTALFPQLARGYRESTAALGRLERHLTLRLALGGVAVGGALALGAGPIVRIALRPEFARAVPTLQVLAAAVPLLFVNCGLLHFFVARDRGTFNVVLGGAMVLVNVAANLLLCERLGSIGSALATVVTEAALCVCCVYALRVVRRDDRPSAPRGR